MKSFKQHVQMMNEAPMAAKGWVNAKTKKADVSPMRSTDVFHVTLIAKDPERFGLTKQKIVDWFDVNGFGDDPEKEYEDLVSGKNDVMPEIESMAMNNGWVRFAVDDYGGEITAESWKDVQEAAKFILKHSGMKRIAEAFLKPPKGGTHLRVRRFGSSGVASKTLIKDTDEFTKWAFGREADANKAVKKKVGQTDIGRTMAQFREETLSEAADMLIGWLDPKNKLHLHAAGGRMGKFHTQILTKLMPFKEMRPLMSPRIERDLVKDMGKFVKDGDMTKEQLDDIIEKSYKNMYDTLASGKVDGDYDLETKLESLGWVKIRIDRKSGGRSSVLCEDLKRCVKAAQMLDRELGGWQGISTDQFWVADGGSLVADEKTWEMYLKTGRVPKRTDIGRTMSQFRECVSCGCRSCNEEPVVEAEYQGRKVTLNEPFRTPGESKKFAVYTKNQSGKVVIVRFGDPNMEIRRDDAKARANFRSRHGCDKDPGPKWKAKYWSCYQWRSGAKVDD